MFSGIYKPMHRPLTLLEKLKTLLLRSIFASSGYWLRFWHKLFELVPHPQLLIWLLKLRNWLVTRAVWPILKHTHVGRFLTEPAPAPFCGAVTERSDASQPATAATQISALSFCGCSWLMLYHCGVATYLHSAKLINASQKFCGASSGSLVAAALACDVDLVEMKRFAMSLVVDSNARILGPVSAALPLNPSDCLCADRTDVALRENGTRASASS